MADVELHEITNTLRAIIDGLKELASKGGATADDVNPFQDKLRPIDLLFNDGKFEFSGEIPQGQADASDLLAEAHELVGEILDTLPVEEEEDEDA